MCIRDRINACSIVVNAHVEGRQEPWLIMFKNETHNHPTEIEGFGGAATCLGGAIRDPLSGRSYVYQAMRITGSGDPVSYTHLDVYKRQSLKRRCFARRVRSKGRSTGCVNLYGP